MKKTHNMKSSAFRIPEATIDKDGIKVVLSPEGESVIFFHVNVELSPKVLGHSAFEKEPQPPLVHDIMCINGVQHMYVDKYKVKVERTLAVDWDTIVPKAEAAIREAARKIIAAKK